MFKSRRSILDTRSLSSAEINSVFDRASHFASQGAKDGRFKAVQSSVAPLRLMACLFFEPSTRTRLSFQAAAHRLEWSEISIESGSNSSLIKGESLTDTVLNVSAMGPDVLVVRYGISAELDEVLAHSSVPVINAGSGTQAHPTQALLDAYTISQERGKLAGERVLIVGDIRHSRVARSNFELLPRLGVEIGICGPEAFMPEQEFPVQRFAKLDEGLQWATVVMGLRIQLERHRASDLKLQSIEDYQKNFGITRQRLQSFRSDGILMHPGPINRGVEFSSDVLEDPRSRVLAQVHNGVLIRAALLDMILSEEFQCGPS